MLERITKRFEYPFADTKDTRTVFDYLDVTFGSGWRKQLSVQSEDLVEAYEAIATLPVPRWLTMDYTRSLEEALDRQAKKRKPRTAQPDVIHLLGAPTFDQSRQGEIVDAVQRATRRGLLPTHLIVVGYERDDPEFLIVRDALQDKVRQDPFRMFLISQAPQVAGRKQLARAREYFQQYARTRGVHFYWGTPEDFVDEFHKRFSKA